MIEIQRKAKDKVNEISLLKLIEHLILNWKFVKHIILTIRKLVSQNTCHFEDSKSLDQIENIFKIFDLELYKNKF